MPIIQLSWDHAAWLGAALVVVALAATRWTWPPGRLLAPFAREAGVIALLYALWQLAGTLAQHGTTGGLARGRWIARTEHSWHLPSELGLQRAPLEHRWLAYAADIYYATMHFPALFALLLWTFWRHRAQYRRLRSLVIGFTGLSLLVQLIPVAPPRLLPELGFTDIAARYGQSVYGLGAFSADQLSAVPSVHVGWAVLVGVYPVLVGGGRWRWLALLHPVLTGYVVVATANHWWFDGLVAVAVLAVVAAGQLAWARRRGELRPVVAGSGQTAPRMAEQTPCARSS